MSIIELLTLILVPGLGIAAVRAGGICVTVALLADMMWFIGMTVAALFGRAGLRRFACGFAVAGGIYGGLVVYFGPTELGPGGWLPTTQALTPLNESMSATTYINLDTNETMTEAKVDALRLSPKAGIRAKLWPDQAEFMAVSHLLIGLLIGYLGGKLAVVVGRPPRDGIAVPPSV
ncbi:MAG TPA: hypothetical protein VGN57_16200 [Pirellulaceae bacterium]|nr:hypothetical protein [Pirellulaceae bacterium]